MGTKSDPFSFVGCVHLYCHARLLRFDKICMLDDIIVRANGREMLREMDGRNKAALEGEALTAAQQFLWIFRHVDQNSFRERYT